MTFYQKLETLCKNRGTTITGLAAELGFSSSAGTTWKKSKRLPRNSTLKKIADYFGISVEELEAGITVPADYASIDTSNFRQDVYAHLLEKHGGDETAAVKAYLAFEKAEADDAVKDRANYIQDNHGVIGTAHAPVTIVNGSEKKLTEQELALLEIFGRLDVVRQAQLLAYAADLAK